EEFSAKRKVEIGEFRGRFCVFVIGHVQGFWGFLSRALAPVKHFYRVFLILIEQRRETFSASSM
ncbi:MAG: hypothetical protein ACSHX0_11070, partial [Akkermansiaceae bacterium]